MPQITLAGKQVGRMGFGLMQREDPHLLVERSMTDAS
jgi:hypothetical protein